MKHFKNVITVLSGLSMILVIFFGVNLATGVNNFKSFMKLPAEVTKLQEIHVDLDYEVHELQHASELTWEMLRLMTDDIDTLMYAITDVNGTPYNIDIRQTAEGVEFAFVFKLYTVHPLQYSPADHRRFVVMHDYASGENIKYYLYVIN